MMKRILSVILAIFLVQALCVTVFAENVLLVAPGDAPLLQDMADLLTDGEEAALLQTLQKTSDAYGADVCVVTMSQVEGDVERYANNFYDEAGIGHGDDKAGVLLFVSMDPRWVNIVGNGFAAEAIGESEIESILDAITSDLSDGYYADAFQSFAEECDYYLDGHINGFPFEFGMNLVIALVIGLIVALIVTGVFKGQLKSVRKQDRANVYVKPGSMQLTQSGDYFMYRNVTRTVKQQSSSSSGSGYSRSSGGRSF